MQTQRTMRIGQRAVSPEDFLRAGPKPIDPQHGWPGTFWNLETIDSSPAVYRAPIAQPTADQLAADLEALAGTDRPERDFPADFFTRDVIYGDRD